MFSGKPCLFYNKNTVHYLKENISDIRSTEFEDKIYFLVPEKMADAGLQDLEMLAEMYLGENTKYEALVYQDSCSVIGIRNQNGIISRIYQNPLIILDMQDELNLYNGIYFVQACMINMTEAEWGAYINSNPIEKNASFLTNVYDNYHYYLKHYQRTILFGLTAFAILLVMEFIIIKTLLKYEGMLHSMELAVKTVSGYSVFLKYRKMFLLTVIILAVSAAAAMIAAAVLHMESIGYLLTAYAAIGAVDVTATLRNIKILEKTSIQKALKGSVL